ncbi:MAG: dihydrofolate reductase family protein [Archangium sp.]|nr:dihydrofolate reductase family protein [Archangium sp.]MDP3570635.1 dihydrofolate reductase family protein [Archangium sp.]
MGRLTMTTFLTLDGVMQGPGGPAEDRSGDFKLGGWLVPYADEDMGKLVTQWFREADAFLLGRGTYEIFAAHWPRVTDPTDGVAAALNERPKYVVSRRLEHVAWRNTTIVRDAVETVLDLKQRYQREVQVHGSAGLAQTLIKHGLIDEYRLWLYPVILGKGKRLFAEGAVPSALELVETATTSTGVVVAVFRPEGKLKHGNFMFD